MIRTIIQFLASRLLEPTLKFLVRVWGFVDARPILKAVLITAIMIGLFKLLANSCHQNNVLKKDLAREQQRADSLQDVTDRQEQAEKDAYQLGTELTTKHNEQNQEQYTKDTTVINSMPLNDLYKNTDSLLRANRKLRESRQRP